VTVSSFLELAGAIAAYCAQVPPMSEDIDIAARHVRQACGQAVARPGFRPAGGPDHAAILAAVVERCGDEPGAAPARMVAALSGTLPWHYHYRPRPEAPDLADRIAFAELIGPDGPLTAPDCRIGFTLMAAETFYPMHAHPAVELYLVIAGRAQWMTPTTQRIVPPGGLVLHRANEPHAMRTAAEPLLALYGWQGDLLSPARYVDLRDIPSPPQGAERPG
jgi:hypothetical protein